MRRGDLSLLPPSDEANRTAGAAVGLEAIGDSLLAFVGPTRERRLLICALPEFTVAPLQQTVDAAPPNDPLSNESWPLVWRLADGFLIGDIRTDREGRPVEYRGTRPDRGRTNITGLLLATGERRWPSQATTPLSVSSDPTHRAKRVIRGRGSYGPGQGVEGFAILDPTEDRLILPGGDVSNLDTFDTESILTAASVAFPIRERTLERRPLATLGLPPLVPPSVPVVRAAAPVTTIALDRETTIDLVATAGMAPFTLRLDAIRLLETGSRLITAGDVAAMRKLTGTATNEVSPALRPDGSSYRDMSTLAEADDGWTLSIDGEAVSRSLLAPVSGSEFPHVAEAVTFRMNAIEQERKNVQLAAIGFAAFPPAKLKPLPSDELLEGEQRLRSEQLAPLSPVTFEGFPVPLVLKFLLSDASGTQRTYELIAFVDLPRSSLAPLFARRDAARNR